MEKQMVELYFLRFFHKTFTYDAQQYRALVSIE